MTGMDIEEKLNGTIKLLGLSGWTVIWEPSPTQSSRGRILPETKTILIHDNEPEAAMETLIHEILEIKLRPILRPYRTLVNSLIDWADKQTYEAKERAIEDLLPFLIKFNEEDHSSQRNLEEGLTN